ncbi:hypothetical protein B0H10DRAFT_2243009 [Mycena sp. CBHHK59/15]|nr:hypothetical protein B0H10DRAFT_2243009 [Mycena sp. CBHHK59/15]
MVPPPAPYLPPERFYGHPMPFYPAGAAIDASEMTDLSTRKRAGSDAEAPRPGKRGKGGPGTSSTNANSMAAADAELPAVKRPRGRPRGSTKRSASAAPAKAKTTAKPKAPKKADQENIPPPIELADSDDEIERSADGKVRYWKPSEKTRVFTFILGLDTEGEHRFNQHKTNPGRVYKRDWTDVERVRLYEALKGYARWEVNYGKKTICSTRCEHLTSNDDGVCDACTKLASDASFTHAVNRKKKESELPLNDQHTVNLADQLKDPLVFRAFKLLQKGESTECFVYLYEACLNGKLKNYETFKQLCSVLTDVLQREGTDKKYGIRFPADYLNFMILLRSYGGQSLRQYGILAGQLPCPSSRQLRALVSKSEDALQNPYLIYENMARVRCLVDSLKYTSPVAVAGDCTKVRKRLTYSPEFGGHILGGVLPFEECVVESPEEIDAVIKKITKAKAEATQVRAILVKVPLPHVHPQVVALIPTDGKDDAAKIIEGNLKLLKWQWN